MKGGIYMTKKGDKGWFYTKGVILELDEGGETVDE